VHSLFIDTTSGLDIGLLDSQFLWVEYLSLDEKKPSEMIHHEIFKLLNQHNLKLENMQCFVTSGPGSYTGMRLNEGIAQVFELYKIAVYSFYHFDVPKLSGITSGFWATNAFKGQVFISTWNGDEVEKLLVDKDAFEIIDGKVGYTLDTKDTKDTKDTLFANLVSTRELIRKESQTIFTKISELGLRVPPFYFRSLDEEFKKC
jgi:tRNA threonylcarbamoyladenosine biosynthesis protein TsaB